MRNRRSLTRSPSAARQRGMSLIEIIIVIVLIGAVLAFVGSRVLGGKDRGDYNIAKAQVQTMAGKIESFQMDTGRLPTSLEELVNKRYLRAIPEDPITHTSSWVVIPPDDPKKGAVYDVRSGAKGAGSNGKPCAQW